MKQLRVLLLLCGLACLPGTAAWAQVYRCVQPSGTVAYSDSPCAKGERGGQIEVEPTVIDASEGRERDQKALTEAEKHKSQAPAGPVPAGAASAAPPVAANRTPDRQSRWDRCEPLIDQASGVRQQGIGAVCGADLDDAMFETCLAKVQAADGTGEIEAVVRACTGSGLSSGGAVVVRPRRFRPEFCPPHSKDPACFRPVPRPTMPERPAADIKPPNSKPTAPGKSIRAIVPDDPNRP